MLSASGLSFRSFQFPRNQKLRHHNLLRTTSIKGDSRQLMGNFVSRRSGESTKSSMASSAVKNVERLPQGPWQTQDPFLFCVYHNDAYPAGEESMGPPKDALRGRSMGSDFSGKDGWSMYHGETIPGFPRHPHRGFETITVVRKGLIDHSDSMGCAGRFGGGDTQWMTAGKGISHCEMFPLLKRDGPNKLELFQIWLNLPKQGKMVPPHFKMLWSEDVPTQTFTDAKGGTTFVTVVAGPLMSTPAIAPPPDSWAAREDARVAVWTLKLSPGATWTLPKCEGADAEAINRSLFFFSGSNVTIGGSKVSQRMCVSLNAAADVEMINGPEESELLMLQGRPIKEPVAQHGPFVMNTQTEIQDAFTDYKITEGFGKWPWPNDDQVHGRVTGRFAKYADGTKEERSVQV